MLVELVRSGLDSDGDFDVKFLKRSNKIKMDLCYQTGKDIASAKKSELLVCLAPHL